MSEDVLITTHNGAVWYKSYDKVTRMAVSKIASDYLVAVIVLTASPLLFT